MADFFRLASAFVISAIGTVILERLAPHFGMVDHPGGRKDHGRVVPLVGGVAIFLGFIAAPLADPAFRPGIWLVLSLALLLGIGILDDIHEIAPRKKLAGQFVAASLLVLASGTAIHTFGDLVGTGNLHPGLFGPALTIFCVIGLINALNMIDGLDGLAGGLALVSALALALAAAMGGQSAMFIALSTLAACIAGFLVFNLRLPWQREARVFLGDAGSNLLGMALAYFAVLMTQDPRGQPAVLPPMGAVWLIGLPILDTLTVMSRRVREGRSPFAAGRDHLHHILLALGFSHMATLAIMLGAAAGLALCGLAGWRLGAPDWCMLCAAVAILIVYYVVTRRILNILQGKSGPAAITAQEPPASMGSQH